MGGEKKKTAERPEPTEEEKEAARERLRAQKREYYRRRTTAERMKAATRARSRREAEGLVHVGQDAMIVKDKTVKAAERTEKKRRPMTEKQKAKVLAALPESVRIHAAALARIKEESENKNGNTTKQKRKSNGDKREDRKQA